MLATLAVLFAAAVATMSCGAGSGADSEARNAPNPEVWPLVLHRTGGFSGVDDSVTVTADGTALVTSSQDGVAASQLRPNQVEDLRALAVEAIGSDDQGSDRADVIDAYTYDVLAGDLSWSFDADHAAPEVLALTRALEALVAPT